MDKESFRLLRKQYSLTQAEMGKALGYSRFAVNAWETGKSRLPADIMQKLAAANLMAAKSETNTAQTKMIREAVANYAAMRNWPAPLNTHESARDVWSKYNYSPPADVQAAIGEAYPDSIGNW